MEHTLGGLVWLSDMWEEIEDTRIRKKHGIMSGVATCMAECLPGGLLLYHLHSPSSGLFFYEMEIIRTS